ncbi:MAG: hypothetical protein IKZ07_00770 [Akkermansia sp.]|nr:hypothetical protein [Akkermansia sp.]
MKQYNRIMLGEHGKYIADCLAGGFIGAAFLKDTDFTVQSHSDEKRWKQNVTENYLCVNPDKSAQAARTAAGFLWTICYGLKKGDIVLAPNGNGGYQVGTIEGNYYFQQGELIPHRRKVQWMSIVIPRNAMSQKLQNSAGSIGTCCNLTKYAQEIEVLISGTIPTIVSVPPPPKQHYSEQSLHKLLADYLLNSSKIIHAKTIVHTYSKKSDSAQKWIHPDMIGVAFQDFSSETTKGLLKATETKNYMSLFSYELKRSIKTDYDLKEYFFQALSNSSWANYGYLVAFEICDDLLEEMERLNRAFGIGIIKLGAYTDDTEVLYPARKNELDYHTIDKLCSINDGFKDFINRTIHVINAKNDTVEFIKQGLTSICDNGFSSDESRLQYCKEHHIPC